MKRLSDFIFELGMLKKSPRHGWLSIGIRQPESIADHCFRTALVGWILAKMERTDENKVIKLCLLHDVQEARTGDMTKLNCEYVKRDERKAARDALNGLFCGKELLALWRELNDGKTREAIVARDADRVELIAQAREYIDEGKPLANEWIKTAKKMLVTKSARGLAGEIEKGSSALWWKRIWEKY